MNILEEHREPSFGEKFGQAFANMGRTAGSAIPQFMQMREMERQQKEMKQQQSAEASEINKLLGLEGSNIRNPDILKEMLKQKLKSQSLQDQYSMIFGKKAPGTSPTPQKPGMDTPSFQTGMGEEGQGLLSQGADEITDEQILAASMINPNLAKLMQAQKDEKKEEVRENRKYHTDFSKKAEEEVENLRSSIPLRENALQMARDAVQSGNMDFFSLDKLADSTGIDAFRTSKGAQLVTASKENLLSNMSRISAKGQNLWFEQRLNQMFPKIGQSQEANLTVQEMLEGETNAERAYLNEFDRLSNQDMEKYGYVKKDIKQRATKASEPIQKESFKRTVYRMKEIEDQEKGVSKLKKEVGKNVPRGTPLTPTMAKLYQEKFGENAIKVAEKNGYTIPTWEEFKIYQIVPQEYKRIAG